jgi:hypothetical protein
VSAAISTTKLSARAVCCRFVTLIGCTNKPTYEDGPAADVQKVSDFEWVSRLRYYWREDIFVEMVQACIPYGYEYLGRHPPDLAMQACDPPGLLTHQLCTVPPHLLG